MASFPGQHPVCRVMRCWCSYLSGSSEVQIVCIWSSWCHCHPKTPSSLASFKLRLVLPIWYRLRQAVLPNYTAWWQRHVCEQLAYGCCLKARGWGKYGCKSVYTDQTAANTANSTQHCIARAIPDFKCELKITGCWNIGFQTAGSTQKGRPLISSNERFGTNLETAFRPLIPPPRGGGCE